MKYLIKLLSIIILFFIVSCNTDRKPNEVKEKRLLIYCGTTMSKPMFEISKIIEKQENCRIEISIGGSGNLYKSILVNKLGDLYLPGSESYKKKGLAEKIIVSTTLVGENKAVMMVKKSNPKKITGILDLVNPAYKVVICDPGSGSIGKETKKILDKKNIFTEVSNNAVYLTSDSNNLIPALKKGEADVIINWYATSTWGDNDDIKVIPINSEYVKAKKLYLSLLKYSSQPEIAKKIMEYASSEKGKKIFKKYGF